MSDSKKALSDINNNAEWRLSPSEGDVDENILVQKEITEECQIESELKWHLLTPEMLREYQTTEEAANFLKIGVSTLEQYRVKGGGPKFI